MNKPHQTQWNHWLSICFINYLFPSLCSISFSHSHTKLNINCSTYLTKVSLFGGQLLRNWDQINHSKCSLSHRNWEEINESYSMTSTQCDLIWNITKCTIFRCCFRQEIRLLVTNNFIKHFSTFPSQCAGRHFCWPLMLLTILTLNDCRPTMKWTNTICWQ